MVNELLKGISSITAKSQKAAQDILVLQFTIVNACIVSGTDENEDSWVLVDTGLENSSKFILEWAEQLFGKDSRPQAIILTHGHFDHVGSVKELADLWDVPVYAHEAEMPYITGKKDYPQGDPTVDEGLVAKLSTFFPHKSIDLGHRAVVLPHDGSVPGMPGWRWIHTPGHTEGHVCLFRDKDRVLIAGDAFTTTKQESLSSVLTQREEVKGPPAYLTTDWKTAGESVKRLNELTPLLIIPSHGLPMKGEELTKHLEKLAQHFEGIAVPEQGRFLE
ncbi:MAG: MBL fold metallo-hydrolase [Clostridia bacterium]|nr:MBL fold metallo-hydrolase [Clostridia bacterium]